MSVGLTSKVFLTPAPILFSYGFCAAGGPFHLISATSMKPRITVPWSWPGFMQKTMTTLFWKCSQMSSPQQKHVCRLSCYKNALLINIATADPMTAPMHILRPILFRLVQGGVLTRPHPLLLQTLQNSAAEDVLEFAMPHLLFDPSTSPYASFRESIARQLFHSDALLRLRLKLAITDFCWVGPLLSPALCLCHAH